MRPIPENLAWWDERAGFHLDTPMYADWLRTLESGRSVLYEPEVRLMGDVSGQRLLHLQCHVGTDTLSWQTLGAEVTGVDFSEVALRQAAALSDRLGRPARWVHADVCDLPDDLVGFDAVVATYGTLCWLPSLDGWAHGIARALRPGGRLVLVDGHPAMYAMDDEQTDPAKMALRYAGWGGPPERFEQSGSYADREADTSDNVAICHTWGLGDVVTALATAGLVIEVLEDLDWCVWKALAPCEQDGDRWRLPEPWRGRVPLMFALRARA